MYVLTGFIVGGRMRVSASVSAGRGVRRTDARTRVRSLLHTTTSDYDGIYTSIGIGVRLLSRTLPKEY